MAWAAGEDHFYWILTGKKPEFDQKGNFFYNWPKIAPNVIP